MLGLGSSFKNLNYPQYLQPHPQGGRPPLGSEPRGRGLGETVGCLQSTVSTTSMGIICLIRFGSG